MNDTKQQNCENADGESRQVEQIVRRYEAALEYIRLLALKKNVHLGHPRTSDKTCISCMAFFALNNGAYGGYVSEEDYKNWTEELKQELSA